MREKKIVLASASPRRRFFLSALGFNFEIFEPDVDETPEEFENAESYAVRMSKLKIKFVKDKIKKPYDIILAADTVVSVKNKIFLKPRNKEEAEYYLRELSGTWHKVITSVSVIKNGDIKTSVKKTLVHFRKISDYDIRIYINSGEWIDKAGGYAIQGLGSFFTDNIIGGVDNIIGFPLKLVLNMLDLY